MTDAAAFEAGPSQRPLAQGWIEQSSMDERAGLSADGPVFVDFDYTLFGCNSTELFIASCRPSLLVAIIEFVIRRCIPWRLTGLRNHFRVRDYACCIAVVVLCPWSLFLWRRRAPQLFQRYESREIASQLSTVDVTRVVIVSFGMKAVIRPLLNGSLWQDVPLLATPTLPSPRYFGRGKLPFVRAQFSDETIAASSFLTDSLDDRDLLEASGRGILIEPQGDTFRAIEHLYIPFRYTSRVKYAFGYVLDQLLFVECLLAVIATVTSFDSLLSKLVCMPFFTVSLMCIYEIGYFENDMVAAAHEDVPTLSKQATRFQAFPIEPAAWIWAGAAAVVGAVLACATGALQVAMLPWAAVIWLASLILLRVAFFAYNRIPPAGRIAFYPVLQMFKYLPLFLLFPATPAGALLAFCQVATMSLIYLIYRKTGHRYLFDKEQFATALFALGLCFAATAGTVSALGGRFALGLMAAWCLVRLSKAPIVGLVRGRRKSAAAKVTP